MYILECADGTLYCGSTNDLARRLKQHNGLKSGARYTKGRRPVVLKYTECYKIIASAKIREAEIKKLTRAAKLALFA